MIRTVNLTKRFGKFQAVQNLNLHIPKGSVFGFVGPNGAGKSTTMSILATLSEPTAGQAYVGGFNVIKHPDKVRQLIGYMPDFFGVYDNLTAVEYLDFYAGAYDIPKEKRPALIRDLLELVNLSMKADAYVDTLSRGMKQRLGLARCLVHDPQVLILDEPASGLDPRARIEMKDILKELKSLGKTIIISSHILPELAEMCDTIGIIEQGQLIALAPVDQIASRVAGHRVLRIRLLDRVEEAHAQIHYFEGVTNIEVQENDLLIHYTGDEASQVALLAKLVQNGLPVLSFAEEAGNLEEVFLTVTKGVGS
ncbi:ABC transporter ATP-binding protein [Tumebacillus permanentifrigoris]|uniref:ABC-2 type transport system ATP-binding protein n=1 Tax=Tumebacillus permanentifrigoris TaxID=378543 RepID=A0A316D8D5_9BACL|nr:ABC transporter ATP-binding protein [Tumebacillus permanentifrigoris]PWK12837.1 ABC-2 type transport system ATP-binding protein [Tumebacillus permanentifrigoris]